MMQVSNVYPPLDGPCDYMFVARLAKLVTSSGITGQALCMMTRAHMLQI